MKPFYFFFCGKWWRVYHRPSKMIRYNYRIAVLVEEFPKDFQSMKHCRTIRFVYGVPVGIC